MLDAPTHAHRARSAALDDFSESFGRWAAMDDDTCYGIGQSGPLVVTVRTVSAQRRDGIKPRWTFAFYLSGSKVTERAAFDACKS